MRLLILVVCTLAGSMLISCNAYAIDIPIEETTSNQENNPYHLYGWLPRELMPADMHHTLPQACRGSYLAFSDPVTQAKEGTIRITGAAATTFGGLTTVSDSVAVTFASTRMYADKAVIDTSADTIVLHGRVRIYRDNLRLFGNTMKMFRNTGEMELDGVSLLLGQTRKRLDVSLVMLDKHGVYHLHNSSYTTCEPGDESWSIYGSLIRIDPATGWATIHDAVFYLSGVAVFYFPWYQFPIDDRRHSGLLIPQLHYNTKNGLYYRQPIYINLADNYDATMYPTLIQQRGILVDSQFRLLTEHSKNTFVAARMYDNKLEKSRHHYGLYQSAEYGFLRSRIDYTKVSDAQYLQDINPSISPNSEQFLNQTGEVSATYSAFSVRAGAYDLQPVGSNTTAYARLPQIAVNYRNSHSRLRIQARTQYSNLRPRRQTAFTEEQKSNGEAVSAHRWHNTATLSVPFTRSYGFANLTLRGYNNRYHLDEQGTLTDAQHNVYIFSRSVDSGLIFERSALSQSQYYQTLELRLFALHTPYARQRYPTFDTTEPVFTFNSLFADNRFHGPDRIGDTSKLSYALISRSYSKTRKQFLALHIGQTYYLSQRKVTLRNNDTNTQNSLAYTRMYSPLAGKGTLTLSRQRLQISADYVYDQQRRISVFRRLNLNQRIGDKSLYNVGYYARNDERSRKNQQVYLSGVLQTSSKWSLFGSARRDIYNSYNRELLAGVEYLSCCWRARAGAFRTRTSTNDNQEEGMFIQLYFKGLGETGVSIFDNYGNITRELEKTIPGIATRNP